MCDVDVSIFMPESWERIVITYTDVVCCRMTVGVSESTPEHVCVHEQQYVSEYECGVIGCKRRGASVCI